MGVKADSTGTDHRLADGSRLYHTILTDQTDCGVICTELDGRLRLWTTSSKHLLASAQNSKSNISSVPPTVRPMVHSIFSTQ